MLLTVLEQLPVPLVYLVAAVLVAAETGLLVGLLLPGEATLLLVGFLAYAGTLRLGPAVAVMIVAGLVGDALAFRGGRKYGPRLRAGGWGARIGEQRWRRADAMLGRLGGRGVCGARFVAFARTLVPRLAGAAGMPYRRFAPWNLVGVIGWVGGSVCAGYLAGESYETVSDHLGDATGAVLVLLLAVVVLVLVGRWLGRNPDPVRALLARAAALPPLGWLGRRYGALFLAVSRRIGSSWTLLLNLVAGVALLFVLGLGLAWLLGAVVRGSGLAVVDAVVAGWLAERRTDGMVALATTATSVLRGPFLILAVAVVAAVLGWRGGAWRADLVSVVGSVGAFVPLVLLVAVAELTRSDAAVPARAAAPAMLFPSQIAVVTASLCTLSWLLSRRAPWPLAVASWTVAGVGVLLVGAARLYLGWSSASEAVSSVLLGALWIAVFMVAWSTRRRAGAAPAGDPAADAAPRTLAA